MRRKLAKIGNFLPFWLLLSGLEELQYPRTLHSQAGITMLFGTRNHRVVDRFFPQSSRGRAMDKKLCIGSMAVAGIMLVLFLLDLIVNFPFGGTGPFTFIDILGILASGVLLYMAINAFREVR